jgi:transcription elongation factor GreA
VLSRTDVSAAMKELDALRGAHRDEVAWIKIAQLEHLIATATVVDVDVTGDGGARLGSVVRVKDHRNREIEYELVGRLSKGAERAQVTPASPVGEALMGAQRGDVVTLELPSGQARSLTVLAVDQAPRG